MDKGDVFSAHTELELSERFDVGGRFNVSNRATEFDDARIWNFVTAISGLMSDIFDPFLNRIGHMGDHLNRFSKVITTAFSLDNLGVDFTGGKIVILAEVNIEETLVVAKIQIDLAAVVENEHFSVFKRRHCASIAVQIWIDFDRSDSQASAFQQNADATCCYSFAQSGQDSSANNNVLHAHQRAFMPSRLPYQPTSTNQYSLFPHHERRIKRRAH